MTPTNPRRAEPLSPREALCLREYATKGTAWIADDLGLSVKTVSTYLTRAQRKLGLSSRKELHVAAWHALLEWRAKGPFIPWSLP